MKKQLVICGLLSVFIVAFAQQKQTPKIEVADEYTLAAGTFTMGLVDTTNTKVIENIYANLSPLPTDYVMFSEKGEPLNFKKEFLRAQLKGGMTGVLDTKGRIVVPFNFHNVYYSVFKKCLVGLRYDRDGLLGVFLYTTQGKPAKTYKPVELYKYDEIEFVFNDMIIASKQGRYGLLDKAGKELLPFSYDEVSLQNIAQLKAVDQKKTVFVDTLGQVTTPETAYSYIDDFQDGFAPATDQLSGQTGVISYKGRVIVAFQYDEVINQGKGLFKVRKNNNWGVIDSLAHTAVPLNYEDLNLVAENFAVKKDGKWGVVNKAWKTLVPFRYDDIFLADSTSVIVVENGKKGVLNFAGKRIIPVVYDDVKMDIDKYFTVTRKGKLGLLDINGKELLPTEYSTLFPISPDFIIAKKDLLSGVTNIKEETVVPFMYSIRLSNKNLFVFTDSQAKSGVFNIKGKQVLPFSYDRINILENGTIAVCKNKKWGVFNQSGKQIVPIEYDGIESFYDYTNLIAVKKKSTVR